MVKEVKTNRFISPLMVAVNKKGKKRLCIDLSRGLNKFSVVKKFKIRLLKEVMATVEKTIRDSRLIFDHFIKSFVLTEEELQCGCSIGSMLQWYRQGLGDRLASSSFFFRQVDCYGWPIRD